MSLITLAFVAALLVLSVLLGLAVSWGRQHISDDYFLAGRSLPWWAVALSLAGASFGLLYLPGMIGLAYAVGKAPAGFAWGSLLGYSVLLWVFLPFFYRKHLYSPAEYLGRRYSPATQGIFAVLVLAAMVLGVLAPALYAGGWLICEAGLGHAVAGLDGVLAACIAVVALAVALYAIYGGLSAAAWTSVLQVLVLLAGGVLLAVLATGDAGGLWAVLKQNAADPARGGTFLATGHPLVPWTGMLAFGLTLALSYTAAGPAMVQRCLGARSEWDAKMGVIAGGFLQVLLPAIVVLPGLALYVKFRPAETAGFAPDQALLWLLEATFSSGTWLAAMGRGLVVAAVLGAVMSTASAVATAAAAVWTVDVCRDLRQARDSEAEMVGRGRRSALAALLLGTLVAPLLALWPAGVFDYVLEVAAVVAPPAAVVFLLAFFWPRAHGRAAAATLVIGAAAGVLLWAVARVSVTPPGWLQPVLVRAGISGLACLVLFVLGTVAIPQNPRELYDADTTWNLYWSRLPLHERGLGSGPRNLVFWWVVMLLAAVAAWIAV